MDMEAVASVNTASVERSYTAINEKSMVSLALIECPLLTHIDRKLHSRNGLVI